MLIGQKQFTKTYNSSLNTCHSAYNFDGCQAYIKVLPELIKRWDSERELFLRRYRACTSKYQKENLLRL